MVDVEFVKVEPEDFAELAGMARECWQAAFTGLLGAAQVEYMIEKFQSESAFIRQTQSEGYVYYYIVSGGVKCGYVAVARQKERLFLSKLYLLPDFHGHGLARKALEFTARKASEQGLGSVYLTVNKHNDHAIAVYEHFGFKRVGEGIADIGCGYVMDDYFYSLDV